ncbi:MAG: hypothetical protein JRC53_01000, partial [Deltaproteobacteria bacterium]|nr:hypothetical protein [Deltaproteobacteria bacterium]
MVNPDSSRFTVENDRRLQIMGENWNLARKRDALYIRAAMIQAIRGFFIDRDYLEVETPSRIPGPAPECHIDAIPSDGWYLHTSPEL